MVDVRNFVMKTTYFFPLFKDNSTDKQTVINLNVWKVTTGISYSPQRNCARLTARWLSWNKNIWIFYKNIHWFASVCLFVFEKKKYFLQKNKLTKLKFLKDFLLFREHISLQTDKNACFPMCQTAELSVSSMFSTPS